MYITGPAILHRQRKWAAARGIKPIGNSMQTVEENLFQPLNPETKAEYEAGSGNELGSATKPGHMQAFRSSSALVCNVFDYWRNRPLVSLAAALGAPANADHLYFEQKYPTGLRGTPPNLDVALLGDGAKPFFIESKFTEPYYPHSTEEPFAKSYFPDSGELWGKFGLPRCEDLARRVSANQEQFSRLNAPQLLKHILGLANKFGKNFTLLYLWYDYPSSDYVSSEAAKHRAEVETFMQRLNGEIDFRTMTYQELFQKMQGDPAVDEKYTAYLKERYFA